MLPASLIPIIKRYYEAQDAGHDWAHIQRVVKMATQLAEQEKADLAVVIPAAYLHDIVNIPKNHPERSRASVLAADKAVVLLTEHHYETRKLEAIHQSIVEHSYSRGLTPTSLEAACVQDADRLDALGAIGILRCAATNVAMKSAFYDPQDPFAQHRPLDDRRWMIDHYPAKLLQLAQTMQTASARTEGQRRTEFMRQFLAQLGKEV